jgi:hypothetical protein
MIQEDKFCLKKHPGDKKQENGTNFAYTTSEG